MTDAILNISTQGHIGIVELNKPPHNFFDQPLIASLADAWEAFEADKKIRVILLCANGKSFCAGADFADKSTREKNAASSKPIPCMRKLCACMAAPNRWWLPLKVQQLAVG
nr:enoyl-CoA hydratase/isomerase family protein [Comamonas jiangduensis]